jgi:hypothetical protein
MPAEQTYFIAWKGRRDGPYSRTQLEALLKNGDISLLHRVETSAGQVSLQQLLDNTAAPAASTPKAESTPAAAAPVGEREMMWLHAACGFCFLLPPLTYWVWGKARQLEQARQVEIAQRLKLLSIGFAAGGLIMWALLWRYG